MELLGLLWRVDHALGRLSRQMLDGLGVTSPQRVALRALLRAPNTTATGIADLLSVDRSSVSGMLRRLEEGGFVRRTPDDDDGRKLRIEVTPAGRRVDAARHGTVEAAMERALAAMDPGEIRAVARFLGAFQAELEHERSVVPRSPEER